MIIRRSCLNGNLENVVEKFVTTLSSEFDYDVKTLELYYYDDQKDTSLHHIFYMCDESSCIEEYPV